MLSCYSGFLGLSTKQICLLTEWHLRCKFSTAWLMMRQLVRNWRKLLSSAKGSNFLYLSWEEVCERYRNALCMKLPQPFHVVHEI